MLASTGLAGSAPGALHLALANGLPVGLAFGWAFGYDTTRTRGEGL